MALFQYQAKTEGLPPIIPTQSSWYEAWSEPVRTTVAKASIALVASGLFAPVLNPNTQITQNFESRWHQPWSEPVRVKPALPVGEQQFLAFAPGEIVNPDKWFASWREPVRQKPGLGAHLQQAIIAPVLEPNTEIIQTFESRWHYPWSEPVRQRLFPTAEQQAFAFQPPTFAEVITTDKWFVSWQDPVRSKPGLATHLQQTTAFQLDPNTQVTQTFESRWHYLWSEPVRQKLGLGGYLQQALIVPPPNADLIVAVTDSIGVPSEIQFQYQSLAIPVFVVPTEVISPDKWFVAWTDPVRQKPGLGAFLQQAIAFQPVVTTEVVTVDKWFASWREPVREKPGLRASLQQAAIGPVLDPNTQVTQNFESRWHQPWSEPVRSRLFPAAAQQSLAFTLNPETQIIQGFESRWHYPWSEPVRQKPGLGAYLQQAIAAPATTPAGATPGTGIVALTTDNVPVQFTVLHQYQALAYPVAFTAEVITVDKWFAPWREPVREKPGLRASLQQALIAPVLEPNTEIIQGFESRWHYAWSEPVRIRQLATAQYPFIAIPATSVFETITLDKWFVPWQDPVRQKAGLGAGLQQFLALDTAVIPVSRLETWNYPWSEPVRVRPQLLAGLQHFVPTVFSPPVVSFAYFNWLTEPVRQKPGLLAALQTAAIGPVLNPNTQIIQNFESRWHYAWSEPVRKKPGLGAHLQEFFTKPPAIVAQAPVTGTLFATEQGDLFFATGTFFNQVNSALVGVQFDRPHHSALVGIQFDMPRDSGNVGTVAANPSAQSGSASATVVSASVSIRKV